MSHAVSSTLDLETVLTSIVSNALSLAGQTEGRFTNLTRKARSFICGLPTGWMKDSSKHCSESASLGEGAMGVRQRSVSR